MSAHLLLGGPEHEDQRRAHAPDIPKGCRGLFHKKMPRHSVGAKYLSDVRVDERPDSYSEHRL